jgi:uncharacterized protein (TIGR00730 family)
MAREISSICVYCGAADGSRPAYREAARSLGQLLAGQGLRLIYGGGHVGLMGTLADAALAAGGEVTGVIPQQLIDKELGHRGLTELRIVADMHQRKQQMASMADAFIALPGGWGTLEELTEMLTWLQLGFHDKPVGLLNVAGYFDHLLAFAEHMQQEGFLRHSRGDLYQVDANAAYLLQRLRTA